MKRSVLVAILAVAVAAEESTADVIAEARAAAKRGDADAADALLERAEESAPGEALMLRGNLANYLRKQPAQAEKFYRASIEADATRWDSNYFLASLLVSQKRAAEAIPCLAEAGRLEPTNLQVPTLLGQVHAELGEWEPAAAAFSRAASIDVHASHQPLLMLARTGMKLGHIAEALQAFRDVSELQPWQAQTSMELAGLLVRLESTAPPVARAANAAARAPTICELRDAALALQPGLETPGEVVRWCEGAGSKMGESKVLRASTAPGLIATARALENGPCALLSTFLSLAAFARPEGNGSCTVRIGVGEHVRMDRRGEGGIGVVIPAGIELIIEGQHTGRPRTSSTAASASASSAAASASAAAASASASAALFLAEREGEGEC